MFVSSNKQFVYQKKKLLISIWNVQKFKLWNVFRVYYKKRESITVTTSKKKEGKKFDSQHKKQVIVLFSVSVKFIGKCNK